MWKEMSGKEYISFAYLCLVRCKGSILKIKGDE